MKTLLVVFAAVTTLGLLPNLVTFVAASTAMTAVMVTGCAVACWSVLRSS